MKIQTEVAAPKVKGEIHVECGGQIFRSSNGVKCLKCGALLGGQNNGVDLTPRRNVNQGSLVNVQTSRPSVAVTSGRVL